MRQLLPVAHADVDPSSLYRRLGARPDGRPSVRVNMIASVDGAATVAGRSGGLGGPADKALFSVLRSAADVVLVGAGTLRAERYGPARVSDERRAERVARGLDPVPPIAVITASCRLDLGTAFFTAAQVRPIVVTVAAADPALVAEVSAVAEVIVAGHRRVELSVALERLAGRGFSEILAEGGPSVVGELEDADLVDELCLTVSPAMVGGGDSRIAAGPSLPEPRRLVLASLCEEDGFLFARYRRRATGPA
jgi:riboflavin biosynthesis pyrimidine reductase